MAFQNGWRNNLVGSFLGPIECSNALIIFIYGNAYLYFAALLWQNLKQLAILIYILLQNHSQYLGRHRSYTG
jgi:hypothetical protein